MMVPGVKWWGWGRTDHFFELRRDFLTDLFTRLQVPANRSVTPPPATCSTPPAHPDAARAFSSIQTQTDDFTRWTHAAGKSYTDLVRLRSGILDRAPDGVLFPKESKEVTEAIRAADRNRIAIVPFGGGTSVVGGVEPRRGSCSMAVAVDLRELSHALEIDRHACLARIEAGILGPDLERILNADGFTMGHFPQSFEFSTLGGWIATRSAGQASTFYGRIEDMVAGVRLITPSGEIVTAPVPASSSGPELRESILGSEGVLGIITEAVMKIHPLPETRIFTSALFRDFDEGLECLRAIIQKDMTPAVARLSDASETELMLKLSGAHERWGFKIARVLGKSAYLDHGSHLMVAFEGPAWKVDSEFARAAETIRRCGGWNIGSRPGKTWERNRYTLPYLRDTLMDYGILIETLETAATWKDLRPLYTAVRRSIMETIRKMGHEPLVGCHLSHLYLTGASLYFTFLCDAPPGGEIDLWRAIKSSACDAILAHRGTLSHHHGVGTDHRPWLSREKGALALDALRSFKRHLDPNGIMNPEKLL